MPTKDPNPAVFGQGAKLVRPRQAKGNNTLGISGIDLMRKINDGVVQKVPSEFIKEMRSKISHNCEELIEQGARIRPLIVDGKSLGWVRGIHLAERKILNRWILDSNDFLSAIISLCTTLSKKEIEELTGNEVRRLAELIAKMSEFDLSLYPFMSAFVSTSISENLWYGQGTRLTSYEDRIIKFPDGRQMRIMTPPDHARLWATLCNYREMSKARLDANFNALMILQPWAGKSAEPLRAELKAAQRSMIVDGLEPWENIVKITKEIQVDDGWGHSMHDDSVESLQRELRGMFEGDKHERFMEKFYEQQRKTAEKEKHKFDEMLTKRGGPGIRMESMEIITEAEVKQRERDLKKGRPTIPVVAEREIVISPEDKIQKYR